MSAATKIPPRCFVGPASSHNGHLEYPIYDRRRLVERRAALDILAWCASKLDAENVAAAMNLVHSKAR